MAHAHGLPTERSFGRSVGGVLLALSALTWWRGHPTIGSVLLTIGALLVVLAFVAPAALKTPNRVWWRIAQAIGWVNARIILTLFFAGVLTPVGVAMRAFGRHPLRGLAGATNWRPYPPRRHNPSHYEHLF